LSADLSDTTTTTIHVKNALALSATSFQFVIQVGSEQMLVTAVDTTNNTLTVQRHVNGTTAATHSKDEDVFPAFDQRGQARQVNGHFDIGAFQTQANPFVVTTASDPGGQSGLLSLREAVNLANAYADAGAQAGITFAAGVSHIILAGSQLELSGHNAT